MRIFLIGFMGSGKTTIGRQLVSMLGYKFIDQDELIEKHYNMTVSEIFATFGEEKFRETEHEVLADLIMKKDDFVISTGGGAPCFSDNMQLMNNNGMTVYLKADPKTLVHRLKDSTETRPLLKGKTELELLQFVTNKLAEREPYYNQAKLIIPTDDLQIEDVIIKLKESL